VWPHVMAFARGECDPFFYSLNNNKKIQKNERRENPNPNLNLTVRSLTL